MRHRLLTHCILAIAATVYLVGGAAETERRFVRDQVVRIVVDRPEIAKIFRELEQSSTFQLDYWTDVPDRGEFDVHIPAGSVALTKQFLTDNDIKFINLTDNLQFNIDREKFQQEKSAPRRALGDIVGSYARHDEVVSWLQTQCSEYGEIASCIDIGTSTEGRPLRLIKITDGSGEEEKPIVWVDAVIHAREWIAEGSVVWIIDYMLKNAKTDYKVKEALARYDFHILAIVNPDGYEYTHKVDRMWRKTRSRHGQNVCFGVDGNRNFDFLWGHAGASSSQCQDTYMGPTAFSEPETEAIRVYFNDLWNQRWKFSRVKILFSLHSYSQLWLTQWGDGSKPEDNDEVVRVGRAGVVAISRVNGRTFLVGTPPELLGYKATGTTNDWGKGGAGVQYSYVLELRPRDAQGSMGFIVDQREIEPSGREIWAGIYAASMAVPDSALRNE